MFLAEKGRVAGEQSSRNWGWIRQQGRDAAELPIMMRARALWLEVDRETNGQCGVSVNGCYYIASSEQGVADQEAWLAIAQEHGLDSRRLSRGALSEAFSGQIPDRWLGGIVTPSDMRGEPWQAVPAVARLAQREGVQIREDCAVRALDLEAGRVTGVVTEHGRVACEQVVLAGGAWSSLFARNAGLVFPQLSVRATVAQTAPMDEFFSGNAADEEFAIRRRVDGGYSLAPSGAHAFYVGPDMFRNLGVYMPLMRRSWRDTEPSAAAPTGFPDGWRTPRRWAADDVSPFEKTRVLEPLPDQKDIVALQDRFAARFAGLGRPEIKSSWAGMIDTMPDVVPIVDRAPMLDGLVIATGMSGHGFGIGPGMGQVVANMVQGKEPEFDLSRFRFGRFTDGAKMDLGASI